jgi:hypothetical protein
MKRFNFVKNSLISIVSLPSPENTLYFSHRLSYAVLPEFNKIKNSVSAKSKPSIIFLRNKSNASYKLRVNNLISCAYIYK